MLDLVLQQRIQALLQESVKRKDAGVDKDGVGGCMWYQKHSFWNLPSRKVIEIQSSKRGFNTKHRNAVRMVFQKRNEM